MFALCNISVFISDIAGYYSTQSYILSFILTLYSYCIAASGIGRCISFWPVSFACLVNFVFELFAVTYFYTFRWHYDCLCLRAINDDDGGDGGGSGGSDCDAHGYLRPCVTYLAVACRQAWLTYPQETVIGSRGRRGVADGVDDKGKEGEREGSVGR